MTEIYRIYDHKLYNIKTLNNVNATANIRILSDDIQFQFNGSLRIKINNLGTPASLQIVESDGADEFVYDYNDGAAFTKAREFEFTVKSGYKYNIILNNTTTIGNLQIFYRRE